MMLAATEPQPTSLGISGPAHVARALGALTDAGADVRAFSIHDPSARSGVEELLRRLITAKHTG